MKPEQEEKLEKALSQAAASLEKMGVVDRKLESLEAGLKELADAFRTFTEGFAKSFSAEKRLARTSVTVSKEEDSRYTDSGREVRRAAHSDSDPGLLDAMKAAHARPVARG